jgi:Holliday junction resolvase RusA-like endonuclease
MSDHFIKFYQNPKIDFLFGFSGGDPAPTKQDKFKPIDVIQIDDNGTEKFLKDFYVRKPDPKSTSLFISNIQTLARKYFNEKNIILKPNEVEVVLSFSIVESRYKVVDIDNLAKVALDSLKTIAFEDDSQVVSLICNKFVHPFKVNSLFIGITKLSDQKKGFMSDIKLFSTTPWNEPTQER